MEYYQKKIIIHQKKSLKIMQKIKLKLKKLITKNII